MFCNTPLTPPAVLAAKRRPNHTLNAEILIVKFPEIQQLCDNYLLLDSAARFGHIAWILCHADYIKVTAQSVYNPKDKIEYEMSAPSGYDKLAIVITDAARAQEYLEGPW